MTATFINFTCRNNYFKNTKHIYLVDKRLFEMEENQFSSSKQYDSYKGKGHYSRRDNDDLNLNVQTIWFKHKTLRKIWFQERQKNNGLKSITYGICSQLLLITIVPCCHIWNWQIKSFRKADTKFKVNLTNCFRIRLTDR